MRRIDEITSAKIDRSVFAVFDSFEELDNSEREYWFNSTPEERLTALEMMRRNTFGYDEDERGLQGFLEVAERQKN